MGGFSSEREVSLKSGTAVAEGLEKAGYDVVPVDVTDRNLSLPDGVEAVFIALHGMFGEDGQIQQQLDEAAMPYTGSGAESSRLAFDKLATKRILVENNIPTPDYEILSGESAARTLALPLVVKPLLQGSSIGVHRVLEESVWADAYSDAVRFDGKVLVESCISGRELTVGIVGDIVLPVLEIRAPEGYYDYSAKYTKGLTEYLVPAPLDKNLSEKCAELAWKTYNALGCRGFGRVDIMLDDNGGAFVLELNSIPGFTETSLLPKAASAIGIAFPELCDKIMNMAAYG